MKDGRRGAATESIALMRSIEVVELQEAVKVLKYPYELLEYGPNGVNGVILITTKQGKQALK